MCIHNLPIIVILMVYPFILVKMMPRPRKTKQKTGTTKTTTSNRTVSAEDALTVAPKASINHSTNKMATADNKLGRWRMMCGNGFLTLTFMCLVVLVTLLPAQLFYSSLAFRLNIYINVGVTNFLYGLMGLCDPVAFLLTVKNLREAMGKLFKCQR
ncbi:hypothetical protein RvY_16906 [Ramazzottius varieornatus]|uniref:G-protein coupled receptors family 1 profile domain-containing protein n=1 Tax=Ramazzottius varieornatus TaxID=947166 RepID=A0A1D1W160_RAMVA|nr:hypothetical protein RvY_16906 [Ramazzottius varieornatus]